MGETSTTTRPDTESAVFSIALEAIALHMREHHLPVPAEIRRSLFGPLGVEIVLEHWDGDWQAWLASVLVDNEHNEYRPADETIPEPRLRTRWLVRLPDTGTRCSLIASRSLPRALEVVGSGS